MPTGYTEVIEKDGSFETFLLRCARAFGACVTMREDSVSKPAPRKLTPISDYHIKALKKSQEEYIKLQETPLEAAEHQASIIFNEEVLRNEEYIQGKNELKKKYSTMRAEVLKWVSPSKDHDELKQFMLDQIELCKSDWDSSYWVENAPIKLSGEVWLGRQKERALRDINYHQKEMAKEEERYNSRNEWLRLLYESIGR